MEKQRCCTIAGITEHGANPSAVYRQDSYDLFSQKIYCILGQVLHCHFNLTLLMWEILFIGSLTAHWTRTFGWLWVTLGDFSWLPLSRSLGTQAVLPMQMYPLCNMHVHAACVHNAFIHDTWSYGALSLSLDKYACIHDAYRTLQRGGGTDEQGISKSRIIIIFPQ